MEVSFKGIQNVSAYYRKSYYHTESKIAHITMLLNNFGQKDLADFSEVIKESKTPLNNLLDLTIVQTRNNINPKKPYLDVNVGYSSVEECEENLPFLIKINNLLKRVISGKENIQTDRNYFENKRYNSSFEYEFFLNSKKTPNQILEKTHNKDFVQRIVKPTQETLEKYIKNSYIEGIRQKYKGVKEISGYSYQFENCQTNKLIIGLNQNDKAFYNKFLAASGNKIKDNNIVLFIGKNKASNEISFKINNTSLEINEENLPVIKKTLQMLQEIQKTTDEIPFPKNYLTEGYFNIYENNIVKAQNIKDLYLLSKYNPEIIDSENLEAFKMLTDEKSIKTAAKNFSQGIEKLILDYYS